jgi:DnaJ-class molecular chaperone
VKNTETVRRAERCGNCDGEGYGFYCDDYLEGQCVTGWDMPCDECKGKGFVWIDVKLPDPKWARMWKQINSETPES